MIVFTVLGLPRPQGRPRFARRTGHAYDPSAAAKESFLAKALAWKPDVPLDGPLQVNLTFTFHRPKSHLTSKGEVKPNAPTAHTQRPDLDNLAKLVYDSLNGVFFLDDRQICQRVDNKGWGEMDSTVVQIQEVMP